MNTFKVEFPQGKIKLNKQGTAYLVYDRTFVNQFNKDGNEVQLFTDKAVSEALMGYVSLKSGVQQKSIKISTVLGSGIVTIGVPYAEYQAYSKKIKKRVGKRGTQPFERMRSDKKDSILRQVSAYSKRLNDG